METECLGFFFFFFPQEGKIILNYLLWYAKKPSPRLQHYALWTFEELGVNEHKVDQLAMNLISWSFVICFSMLFWNFQNALTYHLFHTEAEETEQQQQQDF